MNDYGVDIDKITAELETFFNIKAPKINIVIINSREEFDKIRGVKTQSWQAGMAKEGVIYAIHPEKLEKITTHKKESHPIRIKHEIVHLFYKKCTDGEGRPRWLNEGLAYYLANQKQWELSEENKLSVTSYFSDTDKNIYGIGEYMVRTLIDKYGKEKLVKLIKSIKPPLTENKFNDLFKKVYGFNFTKDNLKKLIN